MKHLTDTIREALEFFECGSYSTSKALTAITALSELERMAGEQKPVARVDGEGQVAWFAPIPEDGANLYAAPPAQQPQEEHLTITWDEQQTRILAVTMQDEEGRILKVLAEAPAQQPQYEAGDMASAHNDGFRAGVASVAQQPQAEAAPEMHDALCPALTGGDCTCTPPATIDKAWAQFCGGIGRGPDAPYPGMIEAFEAHYGQTFTDKDWREETGVWAAAWKAAKAHGEAAPQQAEAVPSDVVRLLQGASDWICDHVPTGTHAATTWAKKLQDAAIAAQGEKP